MFGPGDGHSDGKVSRDCLCFWMAILVYRKLDKRAVARFGGLSYGMQKRFFY